jgi:hypothetical protein
MNNTKNTVTSICALVILAAGALKTALDAQVGEVNWFVAVSAVGVAVIGWFTGKK